MMAESDPPGGSNAQIAWSTPLSDLPQITPARLKALEAEGLRTVHDLIRHYPRRHEDRRRFPSFPSAAGEHPLCLRGTVLETKMARFGRRCQFSLTLAETDGSATVRCRWFNLRYLTKILQAGQDLVIHGRPRALKKGGLIFEHPDFEVLETDTPDSALIHVGRIAPVHPSIGPLSPRVLRRIIYELLEALEDGNCPEPAEAAALRQLHFPEGLAALEDARATLAKGELFEMQCVLVRQRQRQTAGAAPVISRTAPLLGQFVKALPFKLTAAQKRVLGEIFDDLGSGVPMNRLLHGDVGSGKTVVAATAMLGAVAAGHSAALMAPTQILAQQHYENFRHLLGPLGVDVVLRTGSRRTSPDTGTARVVIGTHALLFAPEALGQPAVAVIDEQHKFGVKQRAKLSAQTPHPHVLVMSATPIPRTLALTLYGDLELSLLDEMPPGRVPVRTLARPHAKLREAAAFVAEQLGRGRQAFLVYPVIDEGKRAELKAATAEFERWRELLEPHRCALLHGKLKADEKDLIMDQFRRGDIRALVSTTVIEVGVDVPNATVLLVENAERFGLAQLHQLRGRVGRGAEQSWCVLLAGDGADDKLPRLQILEKAADGFTIAEADLELRGPGDLLGTAQTGLPPIRLARLPRDLPLLEEARRQARELLGSDPDLVGAPELRERLRVWEKRLYAGVA